MTAAQRTLPSHATRQAQLEFGRVQPEWVSDGDQLYIVDYSLLDAISAPPHEDGTRIISAGYASGSPMVVEASRDIEHRSIAASQHRSIAASVSLTDIPPPTALGMLIARLFERIRATAEPVIVVSPRPYAALAPLLPYAAGFVFEQASTLCQPGHPAARARCSGYRVGGAVPAGPGVRSAAPDLGFVRPRSLMNHSILVFLYRAGDHRAPVDHAFPPVAVLHARSSSVQYGDNGLFVSGEPMKVHAVQISGGAMAKVKSFDYDFRYFSPSRQRLSHGATAQLQSVLECLQPEDTPNAMALVPMVMAVPGRHQWMLYHYVQQAEPGAVYLKYHCAPPPSALAWTELTSLLQAGRRHLVQAWPLLNDDCWFS